ncbi:UNVERIFIED_CONTAM: hypothetical protein Sradi_2998500 [Sesamum radiatum]|uniref:Reverse transcriptase Ty1/copia-type domain-containing protein n=1 Tax=Sesamum radiatum TaxID=300843 RepID=A0AAW2S0T4_SESRA
MTNAIQKQYDRLDDVSSIMHRMKEVYAVRDQHITYTTTKAFFGTKMAEGSSVQSHGVKMLFIVKKLEDLKAGLENDTYIDVILQSLPPSYDPYIVNYNMNGLEKSIHELINMLVQYEATTHKSEPAVLVGEASTSKAKGKRAGRRKRNKGKGKAVVAITSAGGAPATLTGKGKGKKLGVLSGRGQMMWACIAKKRDIGRGSVHNSSPTQDFPSDSRRDEVLLEESSEEPQHNSTTTFEPPVLTNSVPLLRRSTRESRVPERYGFMGLTSQLDNDPKTYGEAMSDIDSEKWLEAMKFEMDSMGSNQVWTLVDLPKGVRPIGSKWIYKRKLGADGEVTAFKARLVAEGYT